MQLTLTLHPRYGEAAEVLRGYGPDAVWLEFADGQVTIVPRTWTSLVPRATPMSVRDHPVRLAPSAATKLARWIAARRTPRGEKLAAPIEPGDKAAQECPLARAHLLTRPGRPPDARDSRDGRIAK